MCVGESLDWGVADDRPVPIRAEGLGLSRTVRGGWRRTDVPARRSSRSDAPAPWPRGARSRDIVFRGRGRVRRPPHPFRVERLCDPFAFLNFGVTGTRLYQRGRDRWSVSTLYAGHVAAR